MVRDSHSLSLRNASISHFTSPQSCCTPSPDAPHYGPGAAHHHELCLSAVYPCPGEVVDKSIFMTAKVVNDKDYTLRMYNPRDVIPYLISIFGFLLVLNGRRVAFDPETLFASMVASHVIILCFDQANMLCGFCFIEPASVKMQIRKFKEIETGVGSGVPSGTTVLPYDVASMSHVSSIKGLGKYVVDFARYVASFSPNKVLVLNALPKTHTFYEKRCQLVKVGKDTNAESGVWTFGGKAFEFNVQTVKETYNRKPQNKYVYPFDKECADRLFELVNSETPEEAAAIAGCPVLAYVSTPEDTLKKQTQLDNDLKDLKDLPVKEIKDVIEEEEKKRAKKKVAFDEFLKKNDAPFGKATERDVATIPGLTIDAAFSDAPADAPVDFLNELHGLDLDFPMKCDDLRDDSRTDLRAELMRELITEPQQPKRSFLDVLADVKNKVREASEFAAQLETRIAAVDEANALMESVMAEHAQAVEAARVAQDKAAQLAVHVQQVAAKHKRVSSEVEEMVKRQRVY